MHVAHDGGGPRVFPGEPSSCLSKILPGLTPAVQFSGLQPAVIVTSVKPPGATVTRPAVVDATSLEPSVSYTHLTLPTILLV